MNRCLLLFAIGICTLSKSFIVAFASGTDCSSTEVYAKITKKTTLFAIEESFNIFAGSTLVYSSPSLTNSDERVLDVCLPVSSNSQYTLEMVDDYGDSWAGSRWRVLMEMWCTRE